MSITREIRRCIAIAQLVREHAVEIVTALRATDQPLLAARLVSQIGLTGDNVLDGPSR